MTGTETRSYYALLTLYLSNVTVWSCIIIWKYMLFMLDGDLSFFISNNVTDAVRTGSAFTLKLFLQQGTEWIVMPLFLLRNIPVELIGLELLASAGVFPLYWLAKEKLSETNSLILSAAYLIYIPIWGFNPFGFGFEIFFPTFFLFGYWCFTKGQLIPAFLLITLGGLTHIGLIALVGVFGAATALGWFGEQTRRYRLFGLSLAAFAASNVIYFYSLFGVTGTVAQIGIGTLFQFSPLETWSLSLLTGLGIFLFLPTISWKWGVMSVPFFAYLFAAGNSYSAYSTHLGLYIPFAFLAVVDGTPTLLNWAKRLGKARLSSIIPILAICILLAASGPIASASAILPSSRPETLSCSVKGNLFASSQQVLSVIQPGKSVAVAGWQTDVYDTHAGEIYHILSNSTTSGDYSELSHNNDATQETFTNQTVNYVYINPYEPLFESDSQTVTSAVSLLFKEGFRTAAEVNGILLLQANFTGRPVFVPQVTVCSGITSYLRPNESILFETVTLSPGSYLFSARYQSVNATLLTLCGKQTFVVQSVVSVDSSRSCAIAVTNLGNSTAFLSAQQIIFTQTSVYQ